MSHYGYEIVQTLIVDIEPDEHVKRAMNEINAGKPFFDLFFVAFSIHCIEFILVVDLTIKVFNIDN